MANMVTTLPASPVTSTYATLRAETNFVPYIKFWEWQVIWPSVSTVTRKYFYPGAGYYYERNISSRDVPGNWAPKKIAFRFGGGPRSGAAVWGNWLTFFTFDKLYYYQAWGVDKHEVEHYGSIKSFYRPID